VFYCIFVTLMSSCESPSQRQAQASSQNQPSCGGADACAEFGPWGHSKSTHPGTCRIDPAENHTQAPNLIEQPA